MFRLASDTMDDDAALAQILAANDELTLAVNAYKEKVGSKECNGGRERSRSEEEMEGITKGWPFFCAVENTLILCLPLLCAACI